MDIIKMFDFNLTKSTGFIFCLPTLSTHTIKSVWSIQTNKYMKLNI